MQKVTQPLMATSTTPEPALTQLTFRALAHRAQVERHRFNNHQPYNQQYSYEIFRRAIVERDEESWADVYASYGPIVYGWILRNSAFPLTGERTDVLTNMVFVRFWRAVTASNFADFPTLPALLGYLRRCTECVVIDSARSYQRMRTLPTDVSETIPADELPEKETIDRMLRHDLWETISRLLCCEAERIVIHCAFCEGMKPREIQAAYPHLFADVTSVYSLKRNVLERLSRNSELRRLIGLEL